MLYRILTITCLIGYAIALPLHILSDVDQEHARLNLAFTDVVTLWSGDKLPESTLQNPRLSSLLSRITLAKACDIPSAVRKFGQETPCALYSKLRGYETAAAVMLVFGLFTLGLLTVLISGLRNLRRIRTAAALTFYFSAMTMGALMTLGSTSLWLTYFFALKKAEWHLGLPSASLYAGLLCIGALYRGFRIHRRLRILARSIEPGRWTETRSRPVRPTNVTRLRPSVESNRKREAA